MILSDILSFYKEEMRGEEANYVSLVAASQVLAKEEIFTKLADDVAKSANQINNIQKGDLAAYHAWSRFKAGFVYFHTSSARYKLDHLHMRYRINSDQGLTYHPRSYFHQINAFKSSEIRKCRDPGYAVQIGRWWQSRNIQTYVCREFNTHVKRWRQHTSHAHL